MSESNKPDPIFVDGLFIKERTDRTPDYILASYAIKVDIFKEWLETHKDKAVKGWLTITIKKSTKGNKYGQLDTYAYEQAQAAEQQTGTEETVDTPQEPVQQEISVEDIPF